MSTLFATAPTSAATVCFTRFEPETIDNTIKSTISAQVHDAMWMLTQQWRMGEFKGTDGGTANKVKLAFRTSLLNRFEKKSGDVISYLHDKPLETEVEKLPIIPDLMLRMQMGKHWIKLLGSIMPAAIKNEFRNRYPLQMPNPGEFEKSANIDAIQVIKSAKGKLMDGYAFYKDLASQTALSMVQNLSPAPTTLEVTFINAAETEFKNWFPKVFYQPAGNDSNWSPEQLTYNFKTSAPRANTTNADQDVLLTDSHKSGTLDWYDFDFSEKVDHKLNEDSQHPVSNTNMVIQEITSYLPSPIEFKGMPVGRWWEFEDKNIDLATMMTQKSDITKLMMMEFGLLYSNDWMIIPHMIPVGALAEITAMVVTDVFGTKTVINAAGTGDDDTWQRWSMYTLNKRGEAALPADTRLFIPPSAVKKMESEPIEKVVMIRDEMANMVWGLEEMISDGINAGKPGKYAEYELMRYLVKNKEMIYFNIDSITLEETAADIAFRLSNSVPENWIPFIPVKTDQSQRDIQFRRAKLRRIVEGFLTETYVRPRTSILSVGLDVTPVASYHINEEEILRQGATIKTNYQRARWYDGRIYTWMGRERSIGKGEGNSGLQFDMITAKENTIAETPTIQWPVNGLKVMYWDANPSSYPGSGTTINDISGSGNDGTLTNFATLSTPSSGYYNNSLQFDGNDDYIDFINGWLTTKTEFSFHVIFKIGNLPNAQSSYENGILGNNLGGSNITIKRLVASPSGVVTYAPKINIIGSNNTINTSTDVGNQSAFEISDLLKYYQFTVCVKPPANGASGEVSTFVNGKLCHRALIDIGNLNASKPSMIGCSGAVEYWKGQIPVVMMYDRCLEDTEVADISNYFGDKY